jgi:putative oxidoreductase
VQRLYTTFPNSWPGAGLFWFRLVLGVDILRMTPYQVHGLPMTQIFHAVQLLIVVLLAVGLWTPIISIVQFGFAVLLFTTGHESTMACQSVCLLYLSLAVLGPGAWSVDARLFGRRRLTLDL